MQGSGSTSLDVTFPRGAHVPMQSRTRLSGSCGGQILVQVFLSLVSNPALHRLEHEIQVECQVNLLILNVNLPVCSISLKVESVPGPLRRDIQLLVELRRNFLDGRARSAGAEGVRSFDVYVGHVGMRMVKAENGCENRTDCIWIRGKRFRARFNCIGGM